MRFQMKCMMYCTCSFPFEDLKSRDLISEMC